MAGQVIPCVLPAIDRVDKDEVTRLVATSAFLAWMSAVPLTADAVGRGLQDRLCEGFSDACRRQTTAAPSLLRQASEKPQGTKPREVRLGGAAISVYGD